MPILKQKDNVTWYSNCHPESIGCIADGRTQCECRYHITAGDTQYSFEEYSEAEKKWCELTSDVPFQLGKNNWE